MSLLSNMPDRCSIYRLVRQADEYGGNKDIPTLEQSDIECWEQQASSSETKEFEKRGITDGRKIFFPVDPEVTEQHVIVITERRGTIITPEIAFEVVSTPRPDASAGFGVVFRVMVRFITGWGQ